MFIGVEGPLSCLVLGLTLHLAVQLMHGDPYSPPGEAMLAWLLWASRVLLVAAFLGGAWAMQGAVFAIAFLVIVAIVLARMVVRGRSARQSLMMNVLATAAEHQLPLAPAAAALAHEGEGGFHRNAALLADLLGRGVSLPDAVAARRLMPMFPPAMGVTARVGLQTGRLAPALRELAQSSEIQTKSREAARDRLAYVVGVMLLTFVVLAFCVTKVVPSLVKMLDEFGIDDDLVLTCLRLASSDSVVTMAIWMPPVLALVYLALIVPRVAATVLRAIGLFEPLFARWTFGARRQLSPHGVTAFHLLAHAVDAQAPVAAIAATMAESFPRRLTGRRLSQAHVALEQGAPLPDALHAAQLADDAETSLLNAAARVGNLAWALRRVAAARQVRWLARQRWFDQVLYPCLLLIPGALVTMFAIGMLWSLVSMIEKLV